MRQTISWEQMFLDMCYSIRQKSKDDSTQVGAVLVDKNKRVISTGFNGPPPGINDELVPWNERPQKYAYIIHAEENALWYGVLARGNLTGSTMYCTHAPCTECVVRMIMNGVSTVVIPKCQVPYPMSKYQVEPAKLLEAQPFPRLEIVEYDYLKSV